MDFSNFFSKKIKELRKARNISQKELAEKVHYSEKAIQKWEAGKSLPNIDVLYELAIMFNVSIDELLVDSAPTYFLGIDGGGTETKYILSNENGDEIRSFVGNGSNPIDIGWEKSSQIIIDGIKRVCENITFSNVVVFAGIAGWNSCKDVGYIKKCIETLGLKRVYYGTDTENVVSLGLDNENGLVVIMGTGIVFVRKNKDEQTLLGGWGYLIDDGGSGYNLGRDALRAYFEEIDGIGEETILSQLITERSKKEKRDLCFEVYKGGKSYIASFAKELCVAVEMNDKVANSILERNMEYVSNTIEKIMKNLNKDEKIVFTGGIIKQKVFREVLFDKLRKKGFSNLLIMNGRPVDGAVKKAMAEYKKETNI